MDGEINRWMDGRMKDGWVGKCIDRKIMGWFIDN